MKHFTSGFIFCFLISVISFGQDMDSPKLNSPDLKSKFSQAEQFLADENYLKALELYLQLYEVNQRNEGAAYGLQVSCRCVSSQLSF